MKNDLGPTVWIFWRGLALLGVSSMYGVAAVCLVRAPLPTILSFGQDSILPPHATHDEEV